MLEAPAVDLAALAAGCARGVWARGVALYSQRRVAGLRLQRLGERHWSLAGQITSVAPKPGGAAMSNNAQSAAPTEPAHTDLSAHANVHVRVQLAWDAAGCSHLWSAHCTECDSVAGAAQGKGAESAPSPCLHAVALTLAAIHAPQGEGVREAVDGDADGGHEVDAVTAGEAVAGRATDPDPACAVVQQGWLQRWQALAGSAGGDGGEGDGGAGAGSAAANGPRRAYVFWLSLRGADGHPVGGPWSVRQPLPILWLEASVCTLLRSGPRNGHWGPPERLRTPQRPGMALFDAAPAGDRALLQLLAVLGATQAAPGYYAAQQESTRAALAGPLGQQALQLAAASDRLYWAGEGGAERVQGAEIEVGDAVVRGALPDPVEGAAGAQRGLIDREAKQIAEPLRWGGEQALHWQWVPVDERETTTSTYLPMWQLHAHLDAPGARLAEGAPWLYVDLQQGRCGPVAADGLSSAQRQWLLHLPALSAACTGPDQEALLRSLPAWLPQPPLAAGLRRVRDVAPIAHLHIAPKNGDGDGDGDGTATMVAALQFDYGGVRGSWPHDQASVLVWAQNPDAETPCAGPVLLQRDVLAEQAAMARLALLGLHAQPSPQGARAPANGELLLDWAGPPSARQAQWLHGLDSDFAALRSAGVVVSVDERLRNWIRPGGGLQAQWQAGPVATGGPQLAGHSAWFALSLGIEIDGVRHDVLPWLPALIAALPQGDVPSEASAPFWYAPLPRGQRFVRLDWAALLPWVQALRELAGDRPLDWSVQPLRLSRAEALRVLAAQAVVDGAPTASEPGEEAHVAPLVGRSGQALPDAVRALLALRSGQLLAGHALPEVPAQVKAQLRPYQLHGVAWMQVLRAQGLGGLLADDMGLGKTLQTLVHVQIEKNAGRLDRPALIVAPLSVLGVWAQEAARFCPDLRCLQLQGSGRAVQWRQLLEAPDSVDVVIAPYSLLQPDRSQWLAQAWSLVVLDEAQQIKNSDSQTAQVARALRAGHRLALTGTPVENHLGEIWSLFEFLLPGYLGRETQFEQRYRRPIEKNGDKERLVQLRSRLAPFLLRRKKDEVAQDLPARTDTVLPVRLMGAQADLYETVRLATERQVRQALAEQGLARSQLTVLEALLKLRQVCCAPQLLPLQAAAGVSESAKLEQLLEMLPAMLAEGRRVLVFSQFTALLSLIEHGLRAQGLNWVKLTGRSTRREETIARFTRGEVPLFLISLKAGGAGLNLPQADTVIHMDPWWNPAVQAQASARAHRLGQTQNLWVIHLVAQGTVEERMLQLQQRKAQLSSALLEVGGEAQQPLLSEGDIADLLRPLEAN